MKEQDMNELSGRHQVNIGHLVMGLAFAGLVAVWAVVQADVVELSEARWLLPLPWVAAGAIGLVAATLVARRKPGPDAGWVGAEPVEPTGTTGSTEPTDDDTEPTKEI